METINPCSDVDTPGQIVYTREWHLSKYILYTSYGVEEQICCRINVPTILGNRVNSVLRLSSQSSLVDDGEPLIVKKDH